ncbi:Tat pathway signal protein [Salinadaptatus halalkaliphilus]|uniref:Tat pathway signal protein n=1 Tax=Salinadaptatus halalkaliphilus TaxID=2419781 RepID=A0A4S3TJ33_9EURY|nr:Tat pathway signal protein [Salinadaptatus halalkaliphilus]THE63982.1 Tat pathway signal protein [Salinadaptatus halalkaliphilus]
MSDADDPKCDPSPTGSEPDSKRDHSRREFVRAAVASGASATLAACLAGESSVTAPAGVAEPASLPDRQHAWNDASPTDADGNVRPPRHHVFWNLSLAVEPDGAARDTVATALAALERALEWSTDGLLFSLGYTPAYFDRFDASLHESVDLPPPDPMVVLAAESDVTVDTTDALLHLVSDDGAVVLAAEEALFGERDRLNGHAVSASLDGIFERTDRRTGFVGAGLPADRQRGLEGVPDSEPVPEGAPFFMGFRSGFRESQATEDRVTIREGPFAGATTQHFETVELDLDAWFDEHDHEHRVARLFSPDHAEREAVGEYGERLDTTTDVTAVTDEIHAHARDEGIVGHAQKLARAREDGEPLLLRRDVNTTDGDVCGLHFVSLQRELAEFRRVREAMAGEAFGQYGLGPRQSNGILQYLRLRHWGSYLVPPRSRRALPRPNPKA